MKRSTIILLHVAGWAILFTNSVLDNYREPSMLSVKAADLTGISRTAFAILMRGGYLLVSLTAFYGFYGLVGRYVFRKKKILQAVLSVPLVLAGMVLVRALVEFGYLARLLHYHNYFGNTPEWKWYVMNCINYSFRFCLMGLLVYFIENSARLEKIRKEAEHARLSAELSLLKSQVNPHFLFNTINDIYALAYQKSDATPLALLKLSSILRYMLHEGGQDRVPLSKELEYLKDYVGLQEIGMKGQVYFRMELPSGTGDHSIAPLLLIPLVENVFKHGDLSDPSRPALIRVTVRDSMLEVECSNSFRHQSKDSTPGIGLANVRRRLELLYPKRHTFRQEEKNGKFMISMTINLNNKTGQ